MAASNFRDEQLVLAEVTYPETHRHVSPQTFPLLFAGKPLTETPCDLFHAVQNYSPFVFNCKLLTLAETAAFLATQPETYEGL